MTCGCSGRYEDVGEYATVWREGRINRTKKEHRCCECGVIIPAGERCCFASSLYDGRWETQRRCLKCSFLAEAIATTTGVCPLWGGLHEYASNSGFNTKTFQQE